MTTKAEEQYNKSRAQTNAEFKEHGLHGGTVDAIFNEARAASDYIKVLKADVLAHKQELNRRTNGYFALKLRKVEEHCIRARDGDIELDDVEDFYGYIEAAKHILELIYEED